MTREILEAGWWRERRPASHRRNAGAVEDACYQSQRLRPKVMMGERSIF